MPRKAKTPPPVVADPIPEPVAPRKKPKRLWLYLPFILLVLLAGAYSALWVASSSQLAAAVDARAASLRQSGYVVELSERASLPARKAKVCAVALNTRFLDEAGARAAQKSAPQRGRRGHAVQHA